MLIQLKRKLFQKYDTLVDLGEGPRKRPPLPPHILRKIYINK